MLHEYLNIGLSPDHKSFFAEMANKGVGNVLTNRTVIKATV